MSHPIITLLTDFGTRDHYVASMKGVILGIHPGCTLVDISHQVGPQDIEEGAFVLASAVSSFPRGTIHLSVVDPGVGGPRKPILIVTSNYYFIGPDNGLFTLCLRREEVKQVIVLTKKKYFLSPVSPTFQGRDLFAPVAAYLSLGIKPETLGERTHTWVELNLGKPKQKAKTLVGEILHVDAFGNLISNIDGKRLSVFTEGHSFSFRVGTHTFRGLKKGYWEGKKSEIIALIGSGGFLEISVRDGNAQKKLNAKKGDKIRIQSIDEVG
jgi:S-adenosyl-L-methionine hydrolase (adenosine-forming)